MEHVPAALPDWRDAAAYAPLRAAERATLAWESLRRDPLYRIAAREARGGTGHAAAARWGLVRFLDPDRPLPIARPLWTASVYEGVLVAAVRPGGRCPGLGEAALAPLLTVVGRAEATHILFSDGWRMLRIDAIEADSPGAAGEAQFLLRWPSGLAAALPALRRLAALARQGCFEPTSRNAGSRAARQLLLLRAADALAAGASQRDIAAILLDPAAARAGWRDERPDLRLCAQRLARDARAMMNGAYRELLRGSRG